MITDNDFQEVFHIMDQSFPSSERRNYTKQRALCNHPNYRIFSRKNVHGKVIAFMAVWEFSNFSYIEHLAVHHEIRGGGIGKTLLSRYMKTQKHPIFLEVEPPENRLAQRRIQFYKRLGFHFNEFDYLQAPLNPGDDYLALYIMSYPHPISEIGFLPFKEIIYKEVYGIHG